MGNRINYSGGNRIDYFLVSDLKVNMDIGVIFMVPAIHKFKTNLKEVLSIHQIYRILSFCAIWMK